MKSFKYIFIFLILLINQKGVTSETRLLNVEDLMLTKLLISKFETNGIDYSIVNKTSLLVNEDQMMEVNKVSEELLDEVLPPERTLGEINKEFSPAFLKELDANNISYEIKLLFDINHVVLANKEDHLTAKSLLHKTALNFVTKKRD
ncbi:MAG: hypothetical protein CMP47_02625 [Rickettsiales bacterium]|nr:hypothetical protein [Rickettsiales bacterium]